MNTPKASAVLIDHDDSFTQNVRSWLSEQFNVQVIHHLAVGEINSDQIDLIVLSPGPKSPHDYPHSLKFLLSLPTNQPVVGICLGMQMMTIAGGGHVHTYAPPLHGKTSLLSSENKKFDHFRVARYHSMVCAELDSQFQVLATSETHPMWIQHKFKKWLGFQFHPESFLTQSPELYLDYISTWMQK